MIHLVIRALSRFRKELVVTVLALPLALAVIGVAPNLVAVMERYAGDWAWRSVADTQSERRVVLVDINEDSLSRIGQWPWSRETMARLSNQLAKEGVGLQVFDVVFPETTSQDESFRESLLRNRAIISQVFALTKTAEVNVGLPQFSMPNRGCPSIARPAYGQIGNAHSLFGVPVGHISGAVDRQGQIRHQPVFVCQRNNAYPALFLVALAQAMNANGDVLNRKMLGSLTLEEGGFFGPKWWLRGLPLPSYGVPLNARGEVRIPWWTPSKHFIAISAADVLEGRVSKGLLDDVWVVVGSTALGLNDRVSTPFAAVDGGLVVHAQLLRGAIDGALPIKPANTGVVTVALCLLVALLFHLSRFFSINRRADDFQNLVRQYQRSLFSIVPVTILLGLAIFGIKIFVLWYGNYWIDVVPATVFVSSLAAVSLASESFVGYAQRARLLAHLSSYLPKPVAEVLAKQDPNGQVSAAKRNITALVADIRNFSAYCESRSPEETTALLHAFFSIATEQAEKFGGRVESFFGDAVLLVWDHDTNPNDSQRGTEQSHWSAGRQGDLASDSGNALAAAVSLYRATQILWLPSRSGYDDSVTGELAPLDLGIGIEAGLATMGSVGLSRRRTHLVLGRAVMVATRIQEMTVELAHPILVGEGAAAVMGHYQLQSKGNFLLEGMVTPCHIYAYPLEDIYEGSESST